MSIVLDILLILIVAVFGFIGAKQGFFKAVSGFASKILAIILTILFYKPFMPVVRKLPFIANMITDVEMPDLATGEDILDKLKIIMNYISSNEDIGATAEAIVNNLIADVLTTVISFVVLFVILLVALKIVFWALNFATKLPVLKQANGILGAVVGVCTGLFWSWMFALVFGGILFPVLNSGFPEIFTQDMLDSVIFKLCSEFNPIAFILNVVQRIF